jgi:hypothetical protein
MLRAYDNVDECAVTLGLDGFSLILGVFGFDCGIVDFGVLSKRVKVFGPVIRKD